MPAELLPLVPLFCRSLTNMGTEKESFVELTERIGRKTGGLSIYPFTSNVRGQAEPLAYIMLRGKVGAGLVWSGLVWSGLVWSGLVWSGLVWSGLVWSGLVWSGLVWSALVCMPAAAQGQSANMPRLRLSPARATAAASDIIC